jgi:hypothetical protein
MSCSGLVTDCDSQPFAEQLRKKLDGGDWIEIKNFYYNVERNSSNKSKSAMHP